MHCLAVAAGKESSYVLRAQSRPGADRDVSLPRMRGVENARRGERLRAGAVEREGVVGGQPGTAMAAREMAGADPGAVREAAGDQGGDGDRGGLAGDGVGRGADREVRGR